MELEFLHHDGRLADSYMLDYRAFYHTLADDDAVFARVASLLFGSCHAHTQQKVIPDLGNDRHFTSDEIVYSFACLSQSHAQQMALALIKGDMDAFSKLTPPDEDTSFESKSAVHFSDVVLHSGTSETMIIAEKATPTDFSMSYKAYSATCFTEKSFFSLQPPSAPHCFCTTVMQMLY